MRILNTQTPFDKVIEPLRDTDTYVVTDNDHLTNITTSETILHPHKETNGHSHDGLDEVYYFIEGTGRIQIDDEFYPVKPNDMVHIHGGEFHKVYNNTNEELRFIAVFQKYTREEKVDDVDSTKGILLAGGSGTRLRPFTNYLSKQLLPVYNKPMIMYPLSTLMLAGIKDILIISTSEDIGNYHKLLGDGSDMGIKLTYKVQDEPNGIAEAFKIGEDFIGDDNVALILGDNFFYGSGFRGLLKSAKETVNKKNKSVIFGQPVKDPERFGVIEADGNKVISIEEKPEHPKSNVASVGLYFFPNDVVKMTIDIKKSDRDEYEITDITNNYLSEGRLELQSLARGFSWFDCGLIESLFECATFVRNIEENTSSKIGLCEEVAFREGFIDKDEFIKSGEKYEKTQMYDYIMRVASE